MSQRGIASGSSAFGWTEAQHGARAFSRWTNAMQMLRGAMLAADLGVVLGMSIVAHLIRYGIAAVSLETALITLLAAVLLGNVLKLAGCYDRLLTLSPTAQISRALQGWCFVFAALLVFAYLTKTSDQFSRFWVGSWLVGTMIGLITVRVWAASRLSLWRRTGKFARTVAIVDFDGRGASLARDLVVGSGGAMHLLGVFTAQNGAAQKNKIEDLLGLARLFRVDDVLISASSNEQHEIDAVILKLGAIPTNIRLSLSMPPLPVPPREASMLFGQPMLTLCNRPLGDWSRIVKRVEDLLISLAAIIVLSPLMVMICVAIKIDSPGPVLFRQRRLGFNNNVITVFKFRSMTHAASASNDVSQAKRVDPRITRVGKFLRRTSIDELPQLFNVVCGDMSLVGPRPHALAHNDQYSALINGYLRRHNVLPGITGWAQVNGLRGETDTLEKMRRRVEHDLAYTNDWSLTLDIKILFMTMFTTLFDRNAY